MTLWIKLALAGGILAALLAGGWWAFHAIQQSGYNKRVREDAAHLVVVQKQQQVVTTKVVTKLVPVLKVIRERGKTIIKQVPIYVTPLDNRRCIINVGFVRLWNDANRMSVPAAASSADAATSPVVLSDVASQHAREANICHANDARFRSLQAWVRQQSVIK